jgi:putative phage abortive infection protein
MAFWRRYRFELIIGVVGFIAVNGIFVVNHVREFTRSDAEYSEHFGAFIGGYFGSLFSLAVMLLLLATLRTQRESAERQDFSTKYFRLLALHRQNVAEIELDGGLITGRKVFVRIVDEFRRALEVVKSISNNTAITRQQMIEAAFYGIFYGVGTNSTRMLSDALITVGIAKGSAVRISESLIKSKDALGRAGLIMFDGHQHRLGHYYRHLYQLVTYVDQQQSSLLSDSEKYEYVKTVRAQLSTHEQGLLLLDSLTPVGHRWWDEGLITKYRLVKNLPPNFFDSLYEFDMCKLFEKGYFESDEVEDELSRVYVNPKAFDPEMGSSR